MKKAQGKPMGLVGTLWTLGECRAPRAAPARASCWPPLPRQPSTRVLNGRRDPCGGRSCAGFVGIVGGALCDFAALGFGAQSIVAPLGSISVVANVVVAPMILGEVPTRRDVLATLLIVAGCAVAVSFASHKDHIYPAEELFDMYRQPNFYVYFTSVVVLVLLWLLAIRWMERVQATRGSASPQYQRVFKFHRFSYAAISGIAGAQSVLFAKTCVELVTGAIAGSGAAFLTYVPTYAVLLAMALTITLQIYWLNCGLARWDALYNVPVFSSFWILVSVVGGGVFYDEFSSFGLLQALLFPVGIILAIAGVYWLSQRGAESAARRGSAASLLLHDGGWGDDAPLLERDAPAIARARATIQVADVVFTARKLGLGLVRLAVRLVDATRPARSRVAQLWAVLDIGEEAAEAFAGASGGAGHVQPGDLLVSVNGESLLDRWVSHTDAMRRVMHTERPLRLGFRLLSPAQRRRVLAGSTTAIGESPVSSPARSRNAQPPPAAAPAAGATAAAATVGPTAAPPAATEAAAGSDASFSGASRAHRARSSAPAEPSAPHTAAPCSGAAPSAELAPPRSPARARARASTLLPRPHLAVDDVAVAEQAADIGLLLSSRDDEMPGPGPADGVDGADALEARPLLGQRPRRNTAGLLGRGAGAATPPQPRTVPRTAAWAAAGGSYGAIGGDREGSDSGVFGSGAHGPSLGVGASAGGGGGGGGAAAAATGAGMPAPELDDPDCGLIEGWGRGAADAASAQSYAGPGWSASGSAAEGARPTGEAAAAASAALAAGVGAAAASAAGPIPRRPRSGTGGLSAPGVGGAHYVIAVYVDNASAAVSPGRGIRTAHHALRNFVMDPMMGVFHMGGLVAPSVIFAAQAEEGEAAAGLTEHPLVALVDGMFPHEGAQWSRLDRLLDTFGAGADGRGGPAPAPGSLKPTAAGAAGAVRAPTLSAAGRSQSAYPARGALGGAMSGKGGYAAGDARAGTEMVAFAAGSAGVASHEAASTAAHTAARRALVRAGAVMRAQGLSPLPSDSSSSADDDESPLSPEVEASPQAGLELSAIAASASPDDDAASAAASASPARALAGAPRRRSGRRASLPLARPAPLPASASAATASSPVSPVSPSSPVSPASPPATYAQAAASGGAAAPTAAGAAHGLAAALRRVEAAKAASRARAASAGFGLDAALHKAALLNGADGALLEL